MSRTTLVGAALVALAPLTALSTTAHAAADSRYDARQAPAYKVTAKANVSTVVAEEDTVVIRGRVTPKAARQVVVLQQKVGASRRWKNTGKATIKPTGRFVLKDKPSAGGERQYRVVKPATNGLRKGVSKPMVVTVFAWQKLGYRDAGATQGIEVDSATVATDYTYPSLVTLTPGTPGYMEFTLGAKCTTLRATYALTDESVSGATGTISVSTDGNNRLAQTLAVGQVVSDHEIALDDVFRLRFDMTSSETPAAYPAVATPEVLCR